MSRTRGRDDRKRTITAVLVGAALALAGCSASSNEGGAIGVANGSTTTPGGERPVTVAPSDAAEETAAEESVQIDAVVPSDDGSGYDWSDVRRRKAISMAIDRQAIADAIFLGTVSPADYWWPPALAGYDGRKPCANLSYDPEMARQLWDEAGGDQGPITFWYYSGKGLEDWMEAVSNMVTQNLGVSEVRFETLEPADYGPTLRAGETNGPFAYGWGMDYPSPGNFLAPLHSQEGNANYTGYNNPDFDATVRAGDTKSIEDALGDYHAAADILCDDMPSAPLFFRSAQAVHSQNVGGVALDQFRRLKLDELEDLDGDGSVSMMVCEPSVGLFGQVANDSCTSEVINALFTGLYSLSDDGQLVFDGVAKSVETTDDGTNWVIELNDGWTFHDGSPVTAQSYVDAWNWLALGTNGAVNQGFIAQLGIRGFDAMNPPDEDGDSVPDSEPATELEGLNVPDDLTIEISLDQPFPQLPMVTVYNAFNPLPKVFFDDPEAFGQAPIGNGPFMMDGTWEHDVQVATTAYPGYNGAKPKIDSIVYKIYADDATAYNDVLADALDIMDSIPPENLSAFKSDFPGRFFEVGIASYSYLGFPIDNDNVQSRFAEE